MEESSLLGPSAVGVRHLGLWAAPGDTGPPGGSLRLALVVAAHLALFSTSTANLIMDTPDDLEVLTINAFACMTTLGMIVKVVSYVVDRGSFNALLVRLAAARRAHADPGGRNAATRDRRLAFGTALYRFTQLLQDEIQFDKTFKMMCAFAIYTYQTGLFCLIGQTIIDQSERLVNSAFSCAWPDADARFKRSLSVFMVRSARLLEIRVGKMYTLSRETFLQILNGSYRLFNLLYQTNLEN
ncbi:uncharacterized protein LOC124605072 [Schistocerca americana]|uniref:uncharacterized protein LOC124605072 n=1 Tax=Schistocerca americana TaxID=7009 RepID=UPI001F502B08|nr:uncharacterized protein LOC124605072 [Schistocerca americana]